MNIHHASLFPDVIGASLFCNELTKEYYSRRKSKPEPPESKPVSSPKTFWTEEKILEVGKAEKPLIDALLINDDAKKPLEIKQLNKVASFVVSYANNEAGIDWEVRDSIKARMRTLVRRKLSGIHFDEDSIDEAANAIIEKAAQLTAEAKQNKKSVSEEDGT